MKTSSNPENTVGVISHGGDSPQVLVSLTNDLGALLKGMHELKVGGNSHFETGVQIAQSESGESGNGGDFTDDMGFGVDPNIDPELAMALKMSLDEELARQKAAQESTQAETGEASGSHAVHGDAMELQDEEEQIRRAIQMSLEMDSAAQPSSSQQPSHQQAANDELVSSLIGSLPGVDSEDPNLQQMLDQLKKSDKKPDDENAN
ncbi:26S proteasome non-ATPase regulatory subunit 4-like protein [Smittium mucronatum]|uniref:26S proteasome non-ATPase regulatory subunit 4-like protein n=1 Tax=Smittium mucronatum TaxID=133383 RepID=A0A1R0GZT4_9FUNG|nr:26S proteasome non-ATPase regulatory subunit 4-like protein [Smittium mucronatum]OLY82406.1 26S proteasome non-ATPase regulatory subunit 4-like protein [Smittium mucronatum]